MSDLQIFLAIWFGTGFITVFLPCFFCWYNGNNIDIEDFFKATFFTILGPLTIILLLGVLYNDYGSNILIKGRKQNK